MSGFKNFKQRLSKCGPGDREGSETKRDQRSHITKWSLAISVPVYVTSLDRSSLNTTFISWWIVFGTTEASLEWKSLETTDLKHSGTEFIIIFFMYRKALLCQTSKPKSHTVFNLRLFLVRSEVGRRVHFQSVFGPNIWATRLISELGWIPVGVAHCCAAHGRERGPIQEFKTSEILVGRLKF